jgi:cation-transporting ATPase 13A2
MCEEISKINKVVLIKVSYIKICFLILLNLISAFMVNLFLIWFSKLKLFLIYSHCPVYEANYVAIFGKGKIYITLDNKFYIHKLKTFNLPALKDSHLKTYCQSNIMYQEIKYFEFKLFKYIYDPVRECFVAIAFGFKTTQEILHKHFLKGLTEDEVEYQRRIFEVCDLDIRVDSVLKLLIKEVTDPFYIFQIFSVILWFNNQYTNYAIIIVITTIISLAVGVYETRSNLLNIQKMAKYSCPVNVFRLKDEKKVEMSLSSRDLVPGDLIEVPEDGLALPCDLILVNGTVIVNEAMLTGESTPVIKTGCPNTNASFDPSVDRKFILYAGTKIVQKRSQTGGKVMALVKSTGFNTEKGNLIRSILFPVEVEFKFKKDSVRYILFMACLSVLGFAVSLPFMMMNGIEPIDIMFRGLDLVTTTVPPALPACLGIGISYALSRLKSWGIFCINRERVNVAGRVNMICFDKTGTLTEDHLDIYGFRSIRLSQGLFMFDGFRETVNTMNEETYNYYRERMITNDQSDKSKEIKILFMECLASCHSITQVNGKLIGDPIDIKMFEASGWTLNENLENQDNHNSLISTYIRPPNERGLRSKMASLEDEDDDVVLRTHYEIGIVNRFDFSSKLQRMSVLTKNVNEPHFKAFCKGSPEKIRELCKPNTIPSNFNDILNKYTTKGLRVLALATKMLKMDYFQSQKIQRETVESNMIFLGLLIVQNKLKTETGPSIETLQDANFKMVMATGDNILTAISVAKECLLINNDIPVWSCEVVKESNTNQLIWNLVETFKDKEEVDQIIEDSEISHAHYHRHFRAESICEGGYYGDSSRSFISNRLANNQNEELEDEDLETLNIDMENSPMNPSNVDDKIVIAITGPTFEKIYRLRNKYLSTNNENLKIHHETFRLILQHGYIFARMSPENKTILVECFKQEKFTVCMCGDGANDCGALRAADVGVSLSIEEASIAAHFTSNKPNISCLIKLFREGKNSLVTSIQTFKYMMIYSLIQFISVTLLTLQNSFLADNQFLVPDLFIIFPLAILIARTGAYTKLTHHQPTGALISMPIVSSILIQTVIQFAAQYAGSTLVQHQTWYENECYVDGDYVNPCQANTVNYI